MKQRDIVLVCCLLGAIVAGMFTYTYLAKQEQKQNVPDSIATPQVEKPLFSRVEGKHFYRDGVHTIIGEIMMPTPCDLLTYEAVVAESYPEQVTVAFDSINTSESCASVVTAQRFMVSATASVAANFKATYKGQPIELNLVEAAADERPESFELYSKG